MVTVNGTNHNGYVNGNSRMLDCASDYEAVTIDVTPSKPTPKWPDHLAPYTHCLQWSDSDGCSHSMTLRADTLEQLLADLKLIKQGIKIAKKKAKAVGADAGTEGTQQEGEDTQLCVIHNINMMRRWSKRTNGHYFAHKLDDGGF